MKGRGTEDREEVPVEQIRQGAKIIVPGMAWPAQAQGKVKDLLDFGKRRGGGSLPSTRSPEECPDIRTSFWQRWTSLR